MDQSTDTAWRKWTVPECPFQIEYYTQVLEEIRLAVVDAYFSLPRGGAEIGGVLLGMRVGGLISILGQEPLNCEHAMGPSFTLSPRDQARLAEMIAQARRSDSHLQPVGWYHSHTRSEIFFSEADQEIHNRFFPEPWQIALVLKPHTFEPTRAGFFFREPDGSIRGTETYQQFVLDAQPLKPGAPRSGSHAPAQSEPLPDDNPIRAALIGSPLEPPDAEPFPVIEMPAPPPPEKPKKTVPITREIAVEPSFVEEHSGAADGVDAPAFTQLKQERSWPPMKAVAWLALGLAVGGAGYQTRDSWLPRVLSKVRAVLPKEPELSLSLSLVDDNGQLKIKWDRNAAPIRSAVDGTLEITDGNSAPQPVQLDFEHLSAGGFTYARQSERVDVMLIVSEPNGQHVKDRAGFLGKLPTVKDAATEPALRQQRDTSAERADQLQKDLNSQAAKTKKLEQDLKNAREELDQKRRLEKQAPDIVRKN